MSVTRLNSDFLVYLAGPITGLTFGAAEDWRIAAKNNLAEFGIKAVSPLRGKEYLAEVGALVGDGDVYGHLSPLSSPRGIMTRDRFDATRCDCLFVNLLGTERVSIGTVMEIAWADDQRIPIVCCIEPAGNVHDHAMIREAIGFPAVSIEQGLHFVKAIADNRLLA